MKRNLNRKGFTLIELLAVIVILAVLMIVAMPNVTRLMQQSRQNAFITEAISFANEANSAYINSQITNTGHQIGQSYSFPDSAYIYYCVGVQELITNGIIQKNDATGYDGYIQILIPMATNADQKTYTNVVMTNGEYTVENQSLIRLSNKKYEIKSGTISSEYAGSCPNYSDSQADAEKAATQLAAAMDSGN